MTTRGRSRWRSEPPRMMFLLLLALSLQADASAIVCIVTAGADRIASADVVVSGGTFKTDVNGRVRIPVGPGTYDLTVVKEGFIPATARVVVVLRQEQSVLVELERLPTVEEHVTVSATRTDRGL